MLSPSLAVLDVETTGLSAASGDRVCEVGIVVVQNDAIVDTFQSLVNPQRAISPGAASVNHITSAMVKHAPLFSEIADEVLRRIDGAVIMCHNAPFDLEFIHSELSRLGRAWKVAGVIDTLAIARRYFRFRSNSLSFLAGQLNVDTPAATSHRALGDALTTYQVYCRMMRRLSSEGVSYADVTHPDIIRPGYTVQELPRPGSKPLEPQNADVPLPPVIEEAVVGQKKMEIIYLDAAGKETCRIITPHQVIEMRGAVYLMAFCHLRQEERQFRLDRIVTFRQVE